MTIEHNHKLIELTSEIVSAFVGNNAVPAVGMAQLLADVHRALQGLSQVKVVPVASLVPAVSVKKSITDDFIICLEDGRKFKSLRRHLRVAFGMTPEQYREKWGLPDDYPMVAKNYSATRSALAKGLGFGVRVKRSEGARVKLRAQRSGKTVRA